MNCLFKWGVSINGDIQTGWFIRENLTKIHDFGVPLFQETTINLWWCPIVSSVSSVLLQPAKSRSREYAQLIVYDLETTHDSERGNYAEKGPRAQQRSADIRSWGVPKMAMAMAVPENVGRLEWIIPWKWMMTGVPPFQEMPIWACCKRSLECFALLVGSVSSFFLILGRWKRDVPPTISRGLSCFSEGWQMPQFGSMF